MAESSEKQDNPLQGYFDWQVTTIMLARDLADPIARGDEEHAKDRRREVENEIRTMVMDLMPEKYKQNPRLAWPPELMMDITRATFRRANEIAGL